MMLRPSKHSHPDRTVIHVSMLLLARLKGRRVEEYATLRKFVKKSVVGGDVLFLPALYVLTCRLGGDPPKTDAFEYRGPNEAV